MTAFPKINNGRRGLPLAWVMAMYSDYLAGKSCEQIAKEQGRSRQSVHGTFVAHKLPLRPCRPASQYVVEYRGKKYSPGKGGYLRSTTGHDRSNMLHHVVWREHRGAIPHGHQVYFKDNNKLNCAIENLDCKPKAEVSRMKATGANQYTASAKSRLGLLVNNFQSGKRTLATEIKR